MPHPSSGKFTLEEGGDIYAGELLALRLGRLGDRGRRFYPRLHHQQA